MIKLAKKKEEDGQIKQGTIAGFMRKRTQLVGFEFGYWKHTQYVAEFLDNALDAIESFQWKQLDDDDSKIKFTLEHELSLENLSIVKSESEMNGKDADHLDDEAKMTLMQEVGLIPTEKEEIKLEVEPTSEEQPKDEIITKDELEVEEEVRKILTSMDEIIAPVESIIDLEPIVIIRLTEYEPQSFLTAELNQKNVMGYKFEMFDNGTGMQQIDLGKYGKYLASSKSMELKQTRGSQGFGAPSAFSDAQNTTGMPIVTVSKTDKDIYATVAEFFTTSKNEKKYIVAPTEIDCPFLHGTYVKLNFLNIRYVRGYVEPYIESSALLNPHITIVYIDPYNEEHIYPRKVSSFPVEPKYAKPHPSSTNIGDLQDLLTKSENLTLSAFLQDSFVRVSSRVAKKVLDLAERDLQDKLDLLILNNGFLTIANKKSEDIYYLRYEKRVYGRSKKERDKLIPYLVKDDDLKTKYWEIITQYHGFNKNIESLGKKIKKLNSQIENAGTKKEERAIEKEVNTFRKEIKTIRKHKDDLKKELDDLFKDRKDGIEENKTKKVISDFKDMVNEVQITKTRPSELTGEQFNSLFLGFKSVKYMSPPTDTAIPVGESVLESTIIKELGLKVSGNLDDFDSPTEEIKTLKDVLIKRKKNRMIKEDPSLEFDSIDGVEIEQGEVMEISSQILSTIYETNGDATTEEIKSNTESLITVDLEEKDAYSDLFEFFETTFTRDDDFVAAETRDPTSGKGLAYVVEAVMAYSKDLETPKRSRDVLSRFVNRTPKLRDSADCAITKAVQSVNWKNYKIETYDNNLPKGPLKLLVNVSGPFVHLMFKSQSKNSLSEDDTLIKEIKYCLEAIGRRLRVYINRRANIKKREKRASLIDKYIPIFAKSVSNIADTFDSKYDERISQKKIEELMREAIGKKVTPKPSKEIKPKEFISKKPEELKKPDVKVPEKQEKPEEKEEDLKEEKAEKQEIKEPIKPKWDEKTLQDKTVKELREIADEHEVTLKSKMRKDDIIEKILKTLTTEVAEVKPEGRVEAKEEVKVEEELKPAWDEKTLQDKTVKELRKLADENDVKIKSKMRKDDIISKLLKMSTKEMTEAPKGRKVEPPKPVARVEKAPAKKEEKPPEKELKKEKPKKPPTPSTQKQLPVITSERILEALTNKWQTIRDLIFKLKIKDMLDARFLQIKLKELERKGEVLVDIKLGKKQFKLKT